jgi:biotin carboxylase
VNPDRTVLLVGHRTETVRRAKDLGLDVILLQHKSKFAAEQGELADVTVLADYRDWSVTRPLAETAHRIWGFTAAVSLTEPGLEIAGRVNDLFGLGGTGYRTSHLLRDKWAMRRHLAETGAPTVGAAPVTGRESLVAFGAAYGHPFIVKPTDLSGGFGVFRVDGPGDVDAVWARIRAVRATGVDRGPAEMFAVGDFLMEEYIDGPEYSVEAFSFAGRHVVLGVTEKLVDETHFAELGHTLPARVDAGREEEIVAAVTGFLDVVGLKDGPSHTELRISSRGPLVIESHNRFGGGRIKDLVASVYGIDLVEYALAWPFGLVEALPDRPKPRGAACVRFLHGPAGRVEAIEGVSRLAGREDVIATELSVRPGDVVHGLRDNWDRLGLIAVAAPDSDGAVRRCEELAASVNVRMARE